MILTTKKPNAGHIIARAINGPLVQLFLLSRVTTRKPKREMLKYILNPNLISIADCYRRGKQSGHIFDSTANIPKVELQ
jgi:hypothetical protein